MDTILQSVNELTFGIWCLICVTLIFFMNSGFAMIESGFTRAKNAGNILMKNLLDFSVGTVMFTVLGFSLMMSENYLFGFIGLPDFKIFTDFNDFIVNDSSSFIFNLVFCATTATIVSGAMAERTKFVSYIIYSAIMTLVIYPIEAGWIWNSQGWLAQLGFIDYAGSTAIHLVGGLSAFIGAALLGARIGKYKKDANGKVVKVNAIPGHAITLGALGCFILWFGWYGFNGAAAKSISEIGSIFATTTVAAAVATVTTMLFTWIRNGKPDVSMCINAPLAGLVGITAGCASLDVFGAAIVGIVSGIIVVVAVEFIDMKLHVDDPVGAVGVHFVNGVWGTLAVGLFANSNAPTGVDGLIYGLIRGNAAEGAKLFGVQALGVVSVSAWTAVTMTLTFLIIKKTIGLRVSREEEITGLDETEHALPGAYPDFAMAVEKYSGYYDTDEVAAITGSVPASEAVLVKKVATAPSGGPKMTKVEIICKESRLEALKEAMMRLGITGMTVSHVLGCGMQKGQPEYYRGVVMETNLLPKVKVDIVVSKISPRSVIETAKRVLYTGHIGDGKIFVYDVENVVKVRTGEEGYDALQDEE